MFVPLTVRGLLMVCLGALALLDSIPVTVADTFDVTCHKEANKIYVQGINLPELYSAIQKHPEYKGTKKSYLNYICKSKDWVDKYNSCLTRVASGHKDWADNDRKQRCKACSDVLSKNEIKGCDPYW